MDSNFHGLPPLKRFRLIQQQQQQQQQQRDIAVSPSRLPAKKRKESRISPSFREPTHTATTYCLPAKKRVWALLPDFIADVSLQAKKGVGSHQPDIIADEAVTISLPFDLNSTTSEEGIPLVDGTNESLTNASQDENEDAAAAADDDDDDGTVCAICQSTDGDPTDPIVFCDGCDLMVHATCYGDPLVKAIPEGDWFCSQCLVSTSESNKGRSPSFSCCLCPTKGGALKPTVDGRWAHLVCALLVPEVFFADAEGREGIDCSKVPKKRWEEKCYVCTDLYGPFWICTTLIFVAASIGTFVTYVAHKLKKKEWNYDINLVTWSAGVFYGYVTIVPLVLYVILKYFSAPSGLVQLFCLYGYSLFVFIPALCLSVVPLEIFRWVVAGVAGLMSATFVALNLKAHIKSAGERWFIIVAGIFLLQLGLSVVLKLYLFTVTV